MKKHDKVGLLFGVLVTLTTSIIPASAAHLKGGIILDSIGITAVTIISSALVIKRIINMRSKK